MDRLDEMDFNQIKICYKDIFLNHIKEKDFNNISNNIEQTYNEYIEYLDIKKYKPPNTMGRGGLKYGRNIIWGWYIEDIIKNILFYNKNISYINYCGGDSSHKFTYDNKEKKIKIEGVKSVIPDFIVKNKKSFEYCIELKTAAKEVFSIKKGNVDQLYKEPAIKNRITIILMIDLANKLFSIENLNYFTTLQPFVNNRMEGQLCYNFPAPDKPIKDIIDINFDNYLDDSIFANEFIKKLKALNVAENNNNQRLKRIIKNKLSIEKKIEIRDINFNDINIQIDKIKNKCPEVDIMSWEDIYQELNIM
jgi:hypothetical protein